MTATGSAVAPVDGFEFHHYIVGVFFSFSLFVPKYFLHFSLKNCGLEVEANVPSLE